MNAVVQSIIDRDAPPHLNDHNLVDADVESLCDGLIRFEKRPARRLDGSPAQGLFNAWIWMNNPAQYNSYTTDMVKALILAFRRASADREVNAVVFTGAGDKAFCSGGNTREYAEYYAGNPQEYRQYMRLFNDMVSAILGCDKPVICRVNGMRIGGVEIRPMNSLGTRTSRPNEVFFDDVYVPEEYRLGEENAGWPMLMRGLNQERLLLAANGGGAALRCIDVARDFARNRTTFGRKIADYQAISHKFADMHTLTEMARLATFHAADMLDAGHDAVMETTTAKIVATDNNYKVADLGVQIMGGAAYVDGEMQRLFREARLGPIGGGSNEILRNVIAARMDLKG